MTNEEIDLVYKMITSYDEELYNLGTTVFLRKSKYEDYIIIRDRYIYDRNTNLPGMSVRLSKIERDINIRDATKWREYEKRSSKNTTDDK